MLYRIIALALLIGIGLLSGMSESALPPMRNFAIVTVSQGYDNTATSIVLAGGDGAKLPTPASEGAFNLVWWNATDYGAPSSDPNREIVRVTARATDTLTVTRAQEGTSAVNHNTGGKTYRMQLTLTKAAWDQITTELTSLTGAILNVADCASYASCNALVTAIGSVNTTTMRVSETEPVASNLTVTDNYTVWFIGAGLLNISAAVVTTFQHPGQLIAAPHQRLFSGSGTVAFARPGTVYPQWWGAVADGSTDDGPEIQAAYDSLPSAGGMMELTAGTYRVNQELILSKNNSGLRLLPGAKIDCQTLSGTGTANVHVSASVLGCIKVTGTNVRVIGGEITGAATVSSKKLIGIWVAGASGAKIGGTKVTSFHAGVWLGGNAIEPSLQNVDLGSNERNLICGYEPTSTSSPQVSRMSLLNVTSHNASVADGALLYSYCNDTRLLGGQYYSNAGHGIQGYVGGSAVTAIGVHAFSNTVHGFNFTYDALTGTIANKLGYANKGTLIGNKSYSNSGKGFNVQLADYSLFSTIGGVEDFQINGNVAEQNVGDGFDLGLVRSTVSNNRSTGNQGNCFSIRSNKSTTYSGNQGWDCGTGGNNKRGFEFLTAATTGSTPPNSTLIAFYGNQGGDTRAGGSRTVNFTFDLLKLDSGDIAHNEGTNANTADWKNVNGLASVSFTNNRGAVSGSDTIGTTWGKHLSATTTWDPASLGTNAETSTTITVTGAAVGEVAMCGHTQVTADLLQLSCYVSAADTVRAVLENISAGTIDVSSGTLRAEVWKP